MNRNTLGIAGVQMPVSDTADNLDRMDRLLEGIFTRTPWVELVLFPELCIFGKKPANAQPIPGPATGQLAALARRYGCWLAPGSLYETAPKGYFNSAPVFNPDGEMVAVYRKMFPWRPMEKSLPGDAFCVFDIPGRCRVGLCICYDQWFPEVVRQLAWMGAELVLNPVMTTTADRPLEVVLSQANAIANQVYFLSVNGLVDGGNGQSLLVDPNGKVLEQCDGTEAVIHRRLDLDLLRKVRREGTLDLCRVWPEFETRRGAFSVYDTERKV